LPPAQSGLSGKKGFHRTGTKKIIIVFFRGGEIMPDVGFITLWRIVSIAPWLHLFTQNPQSDKDHHRENHAHGAPAAA